MTVFRPEPEVREGPPELLLSSFVHGVKRLPATFTPGGA